MFGKELWPRFLFSILKRQLLILAQGVMPARYNISI